jgi:hypothetical protein
MMISTSSKTCKTIVSQAIAYRQRTYVIIDDREDFFVVRKGSEESTLEDKKEKASQGDNRKSEKLTTECRFSALATSHIQNAMHSRQRRSSSFVWQTST